MSALRIARPPFLFALILCCLGAVRPLLAVTDQSEQQSPDQPPVLLGNQPIDVTQSPATPPDTSDQPGDESHAAPRSEAQAQVNSPPSENESPATTEDSNVDNDSETARARSASNTDTAVSSIRPDTRPLPPRHAEAPAPTEQRRLLTLPAGTLRTIIALVAVLGLALLLRLVVGRKAGLLASSRSPSGVLSVLARYPIGKQQSLVLLRMPGRILVLCQTPTGATTLSEITDPDEVASLHRMLRDSDGGSFNSQFDHLVSAPSAPAARRTTRSSAEWIDPVGGHSDRSAQVVDLTRPPARCADSQGGAQPGAALMNLLGWGGSRS